MATIDRGSGWASNVPTFISTSMAMETARNRDALLLFISDSPFPRRRRGALISCLLVSVHLEYPKRPRWIPLQQMQVAGRLISGTMRPQRVRRRKGRPGKSMQEPMAFHLPEFTTRSCPGGPTQQSICGLVELSTRCRSIWVPVITSGFLTCLGAYRHVASPSLGRARMGDHSRLGTKGRMESSLRLHCKETISCVGR